VVPGHEILCFGLSGLLLLPSDRYFFLLPGPFIDSKEDPINRNT
jgi:hypothetical protein